MMRRVVAEIVSHEIEPARQRVIRDCTLVFPAFITTVMIKVVDVACDKMCYKIPRQQVGKNKAWRPERQPAHECDQETLLAESPAVVDGRRQIIQNSFSE